MHYLWRGLQTEWLKTRRTFIVWYVILCPIFLTGILFLVYANNPFFAEQASNLEADINFWDQLITGGYIALSNLFLVLFITLLNTMLYAREHQGNMWKHLYSLPVPRWSVFASKSLFGILLIAFSIAWYVALINLVGYSLDFVRPVFKFATHDNMLGAHLLLAFRMFLSSLGIWAIHNWLSLRFKGMGLSMGIAIVSIVVTPFMIAGKGYLKNWAYCYPYTYPYETILDFMAQHEKTTVFWQAETYGSLFCMVAFTLLGYWEYNRNRHK
jgi:lantibiotic transport system permease protein